MIKSLQIVGIIDRKKVTPLTTGALIEKNAVKFGAFAHGVRNELNQADADKPLIQAWLVPSLPNSRALCLGDA
ncbi:hypothetical protein [Spirosoma endophyticum]|uniref:hypothetical protein n=1 Tax=Spirosoma endophyticum TaxID=662367 RepID=UPI001FE98506|nr:hypothetical protein [Spirosoma endophyticum]